MSGFVYYTFNVCKPCYVPGSRWVLLCVYSKSLIRSYCCSLPLIAAHCRSLPLIAAHWAPLRYVYMFIATHCICYVLSRTHCCIIIAHWTLLLSPVMYISMLLWSGPVSALIVHYVFGYLCSGSVWALYAQIACFDWCHVYSDVIGSCILVMIGSLILIVIGSELFVALEIVFPEVTWCKSYNGVNTCYCKISM